jgi:hypothetical protein
MKCQWWLNENSLDDSIGNLMEGRWWHHGSISKEFDRNVNGKL